MGYWALRGVLALATGGTSEAVMMTGDVVGATFAAMDVAATVGALVESGTDFGSTVGKAVADGIITAEEAMDLTRGAKQCAEGITDIRGAAEELEAELQKNRNGRFTGSEVVATAKRVVRCSICHAPGVNKMSHRPGHKKAHMHKF